MELVERAIRNSSKSRDIVLDLFAAQPAAELAEQRTIDFFKEHLKS